MPEAKAGARAESPAIRKKAEADQKKDEDANAKKEKKGMKQMLSSPTVKLGVGFIVLFAAYKYFGSKVDVKAYLEKAVDFVEKQGNTAVYWYVAFTFVGVVCLVPTTPMEVAGGFLFIKQYGLWVYVFTGCAKLCANVVSVLIARHLVRDWVNRTIVQKSELLNMVSTAVKEQPWRMAFLVRGSMVPLFVKNYGLGVMDIGYLPNACCSLIFTNFYAAQNIYMGSTMSNLKEVFAPKKEVAGPQDWTKTAKTLMPIIFNILLVCILCKEVKKQFSKQKEKIQSGLKKDEKKSD